MGIPPARNTGILIKQHKLKLERNDITPDVMPCTDNAFEEMYITVRGKEGRLYTDKQTAKLPDIDAAHQYYKEWRLRKRSAGQLVDFLRQQHRSLNILEVGCGNGWLSAKLAELPAVKVTGLDPNGIEIEQARRVFNKPNLKFINGTFSRDMFKTDTKFDVVIFAASIQYFPSLNNVLEDAFALLSAAGRIHILDSPFYHSDELETAAGRTLAYYASLGFPQMAKHYFHHSLKQLLHYKHKTMYDPTRLINRLGKKGIFYWIKLKP